MLAKDASTENMSGRKPGKEGEILRRLKASKPVTTESMRRLSTSTDPPTGQLPETSFPLET